MKQSNPMNDTRMFMDDSFSNGKLIVFKIKEQLSIKEFIILKLFFLKETRIQV